MNTTSSDIQGDVVEIRVPAQPSYISTVRLAAAGLAARCDLTVDDIEDLRLAVDEACSLVLPHAETDGTLDAHFTLAPASLEVRVSVAGHATDLNRSGFAWTVLAALASSVEVLAADGRIAVQLTKRREVASR